MQIILWAVASLAYAGFKYYIARREEQKAKAERQASLPGLDSVEYPVVTEAMPVPVLFGTARLKGANVLWSGFFKRRQNDDADRDAGVTRWDGVMLLGFCVGPVDNVRGIQWDDVEIDNTVRDMSGGVVEFTQDDYEIWGNPRTGGGGGVNGRYTFMPGYPDQDTHPLFTETIRGRIGEDESFRDDEGKQYMPAYRGLLTCMLGGYDVTFQDLETRDISDQPTTINLFTNITYFYFGARPQLKPMSITAQRMLVRGFGDPQWYVDTAAVGTNEMNPAHIIHELLSDPVIGGNIDPQYIDDELDGITASTFQQAANTLLGNDGLGLSFVWSQNQNRIEVIQEVLRHINGVLIRNPATGLYELRLFRDNYSVEFLPVLGESQIVSVDRYTKPAPSALPTILDVKYIDRVTAKERIANAYDQAGLMTRGEIREEVTYQMAATPEIASRLATRDMLEISAPLAVVEIVAPAIVAEQFLPGDLFVWQWPQYGIESMVLRVGSVERGGIDDSDVRLRCIEDSFAWRETVYSSPPDSEWTDPVTEPLNALAVRFEAPLLLWLAAARDRFPFARMEDFASDYRGVAAIAPFRPNDAHTSYELWTNAFSGLPRMADNGGGWSETVGIIGQMNFTAFTRFQVLPPTTTLTIDPTKAWPQEGALLLFGGGQSKVSQEIMLVTNAYIDGEDYKIDVERALMDTVEFFVGSIDFPLPPVNPTCTVIGKLIAGDETVQVRRMFGLDVPRPITAGQNFSELRVLTNTGRGQLEYADADVQQTNIEGRPFLPIPPYIYEIREELNSVVVSWHHRNRLVDRIVYTDNATIQAEPGVTYTLTIRELLPIARPLRTVEFLTGDDDSYVYTEEDEQDDRGELALATSLVFQIEAHRDGVNSYFKRTKIYGR